MDAAAQEEGHRPGGALQAARGGEEGQRVAVLHLQRRGAPPGEGGPPEDRRGALLPVPPAAPGQHPGQRRTARWAFGHRQDCRWLQVSWMVCRACLGPLGRSLAAVRIQTQSQLKIPPAAPAPSPAERTTAVVGGMSPDSIPQIWSQHLMFTPLSSMDLPGGTWGTARFAKRL